jgi:cytochrome c-type biogenesis protein CcmH/NrfG
MTDAESASRGDRWDAAQEGAELLREGDLDGAVAELERVVESDPENEYALYYLGNAWFERQAWDKALKAYVSALEVEPRYLGAMVGAGHALRLMNRLPQAIRMANQALLRDKDDPEALHLLGLVHFQIGNRAKASEYLERFLATNPEIETALEVQGLVQVLRGEVLPSDEDEDPS